MKVYNVTLLAVLFCILPATALAQEAPDTEEAQNPTIGVNYWKCDWARVNEGEISGGGMLTHQWGDEWNVVFYMTAPDTPSYLTAFQEAGRRFEERHPDATPITEYCSEHKDNIYTLRSATEAPETGSQ